MSEPTTNALPIVLIHGLWMTARSWDRWVEYYRAKGHEVIVPAYPGEPVGAGRQPVGLERMLRIYFLQPWFNVCES